jgi:hypothetical protein
LNICELKKERAFYTLSAAVLLLAVRLAYGPRDIRGASQRAFWLHKTSCAACADVLLVGTSRFYQGLYPRAMSDALPGRSIFNFAYSAQGYSEQYLDAARHALSAANRDPVVVLDFTPVGLTRFAERAGHYPRWNALRARASWTDEPDELTEAWIPPMTPCELFFGVCDRRRFRDYFLDDGWVRGNNTPCDSHGFDRLFAKVFRSSPVDATVVGRFLGAVDAWRSQGVRVYGLRPPAPAGVRAIEEQVGGFDEAALRRRFEDAGGHWIQADYEPEFRSCDGSHLDGPSAVRLSQLVASRIARDLGRGD